MSPSCPWTITLVRANHWNPLEAAEIQVNTGIPMSLDLIGTDLSSRQAGARGMMCTEYLMAIGCNWLISICQWIQWQRNRI
jgi:hypothetical protein